MSTTIRLTRMGRRKRPYYRLVVVDSRERRDGAFIENLGIYNPIPLVHECDLNAERAIHWLERGAVTTDTARSLLRNEGVLYRWQLQKAGASAEDIEQKVDDFRSRRAKKVDQFKEEQAQAEAKKAKAYADTLAAKRAAAVVTEKPEEAAPGDAEASAEATDEAAAPAATDETAPATEDETKKDEASE